MKLYLRLAWRNIWRHRRRTLIVVLAISLTMAMMMFYDGLINGFQQNINNNAVKIMGGNIQIHDAQYPANRSRLLPVANDQDIVSFTESLPQVVSASRRINTTGLASNREGAFPVSIIGVEPQKEQTVNLIAQNVIKGRYLAVDDLDMVFIGKGLADAMGIGVGDRFTLVGTATHKQMRTRTMTVAGIYEIGMTELEKSTLFMSLVEAQDLYGLTGQSTEIAVTLQNIDQERSVIATLQSSFPDYDIGSWKDNYPELATVVTSKNVVMDIFSVVILFIAGIGILNMMMMAVLERTREIGVMGAMGLRPRQISRLFLLEGTMIGLVGMVFGVGLGLLTNALVKLVGLDYSSFSSMAEYMALLSGRVYPTMGIEKLPLRVLTVIVIAMLASFSPAHEASQNDPAESLHYV